MPRITIAWFTRDACEGSPDAFPPLVLGAQSIFYARDFLLTLQFQQGGDIWLESPGIPQMQTPGGAYIAATFQTSGLDFAGFLRKYDSTGKELWTRQIPGAGPVFVSAMAGDANAVYLAGAIGFGRSEMFVRKYDGGGNELWSRQIRITDNYHSTRGGGRRNRSLRGGLGARPGAGAQVLAGRGGVVEPRPSVRDSQHARVVGQRRGVCGRLNASGGFAAKFTTGGDTVWIQQLNSSEAETAVPAAVATDSRGIYLGGTVYRRVSPGDVTYDPSTGEAFLRKLDANGTEVWARRFATAIPNSIYSLAVDQGAIYAAGGTAGTLPGQCKAGGADLFVRRYDATGTEQWTRQFGTSVFDLPGSLVVDASGVYLSGAVRGNEQTGAFLVKLPKTQSPPAEAKPSISWECVVNAASYAGGGVAPGEIVTIFGRAMGPKAPVTYQVGADGRLLTELDSKRALFNGGRRAAIVRVGGADQRDCSKFRGREANGKRGSGVPGRARSDALTVPVCIGAARYFHDRRFRHGARSGVKRRSDGQLAGESRREGIGDRGIHYGRRSDRSGACGWVDSQQGAADGEATSRNLLRRSSGGGIHLSGGGVVLGPRRDRSPGCCRSTCGCRNGFVPAMRSRFIFVPAARTRRPG